MCVCVFAGIIWPQRYFGSFWCPFGCGEFHMCVCVRIRSCFEWQQQQALRVGGSPGGYQAASSRAGPYSNNPSMTFADIVDVFKKKNDISRCCIHAQRAGGSPRATQAACSRAGHSCFGWYEEEPWAMMMSHEPLMIIIQAWCLMLDAWWCLMLS